MNKIFILFIAVFFVFLNQSDAQKNAAAPNADIYQTTGKTTSHQQLMRPRQLKKLDSVQSGVVNQEEHQYYIYISRIASRQDVSELERTIQKKAGVTYFLGNRYPVRYFLLKTNHDVDLKTFSSWISPKLVVEYYEEGEYMKEGAILLFNKYNRKTK